MQILIQEYMTSIHPSGQTIHTISHERTKLIRQRFLILHVEALCGATVSPKNIALLTSIDAANWSESYGPHYTKYGKRHFCRWCS